jgi:hypothetical protein
VQGDWSSITLHPQRQRRYAPQGDRAKDDDVWILVNHIRSMAKEVKGIGEIVVVKLRIAETET